MNAAPKLICPICEEMAAPNMLHMHPGLTLDKRAFVHLTAGSTFCGQMTPDEMRSFAHQMLLTAEAAESDAMVYRLMREKIQVDHNTALNLISDLRNYRDETWRPDHKGE
jgi:hypothetical protein